MNDRPTKEIAELLQSLDALPEDLRRAILVDLLAVTKAILAGGAQRAAVDAYMRSYKEAEAQGGAPPVLPDFEVIADGGQPDV